MFRRNSEDPVVELDAGEDPVASGAWNLLRVSLLNVAFEVTDSPRNALPGETVAPERSIRRPVLRETVRSGSSSRFVRFGENGHRYSFGWRRSLISRLEAIAEYFFCLYHCIFHWSRSGPPMKDASSRTYPSGKAGGFGDEEAAHGEPQLDFRSI